MEFLSNAWEFVAPITPLLLVVAAVVPGLLFARGQLGRRYGGAAGERFRIPLVMLGLTLVAVLAVVMVLPVSETLRVQLLSLIGVLLSASIALSSTTLLSNGMAGLLLRAVGAFKAGDFLRVGESFGRVSERGLFHTEIQTPERQLVTLPNMYLVSNPVTVIGGGGTLVSAHVSLGYDVPHPLVERLLVEAVTEAGLSEPFVQVLELGDFSVSYRAAGLLTDVATYLTAQSRLRIAVLDALHGGQVEIVSPNFMNTRALGEAARVLPPVVAHEAPITSTDADKVAFAKAEVAGVVDSMEAQRAEVVASLASLREARAAADSDAARDEIDARIAELEAAQATLSEEIVETRAEAESAT